MSRLYPKSFLRLILIGFGLVSLPLVFALGNAAYNVQNLAELSGQAVREAAVAARAGREIQETLTGMERVLRQYLVLRDAKLLAEYRRLHEELAQAMQEYARLPIEAGERAKLSDVQARTRVILAALDAARTVSADELAAAAELARSVLASSTRLVDAEVERLRSTAGMNTTRV